MRPHNTMWQIGLLALVLLVAGCDRKNDYRAAANTVPLNQPLTDALNADHIQLPENVEAFNCYVPHWKSVVCDVRLRGRAVAEMGRQQTQWMLVEDGASPDWALFSTRFEMADTHFNVIVRHGEQQGVVVYAAVDQSRIDFDSARTFVSGLVLDATKQITCELDAAHRAAPDTVRRTWQAPVTSTRSPRSDVAAAASDVAAGH